jgi:hypothetical protein
MALAVLMAGGALCHLPAACSAVFIESWMAWAFLVLGAMSLRSRTARGCQFRPGKAGSRSTQD